MAKSSEQCIFCGWTRKSSWPNIRFFSIPKEPGLKRVRWLQMFGNRMVTHRDRVCSVHFRSGRPSNDPSHEDFVPHLYLSSEPPADVMTYLEQVAEKESDCAKILAADAHVERIGKEGKQEPIDDDDNDDKLLPLLPRKNRQSRPAIMQRKRKSINIKDEIIADDENHVLEDRDGPPKLKKMEKTFHELTDPQSSNHDVSMDSSLMRRRILPRKTITGNKAAIPLDPYLVRTSGIQPGQTLAISLRKQLPSHFSSTKLPRSPMNIPPYKQEMLSVITPRLPPHHRYGNPKAEASLVEEQMLQIEMENAQREQEELQMLAEEEAVERMMNESEDYHLHHHREIITIHHHGGDSGEHQMIEYEEEEGYEYYEDEGEYDDQEILTHSH